ncbi:hypothetical protein AMATHDRAFT_73208 [Amanita thiersii Skay4041]|uniref:Homeobox domain-containing protein n=1 Tax=Amanita thiersii Skay4041 TaxID=703135 RepID=A0A2A9NS12_9AGAR|nr:hypothetical protein AMATHDRAFT_73208 [Amanita thiersii Skay4041]
MSTSSRDNRMFAASIGKTRRSPPGDAQGSVFFTGQGGRTVLPPLSSAFPTSRFPVPNTYATPYTQPRSSPGRYDLNPHVLYGQWPPNNTSPQLTSAYPNYETTERYSTLSNYTTTAYPSRTSSPVGASPGESRRLPPIPSNTTATVERWQQTPYVSTTPPNYQSGLRSPTAAYPTVYSNYPTNTQTNTFPYLTPQEQAHSQMTALPSASPSAMYGDMGSQRTEPRPASPYDRSASHVTQPNFTQPSTSQSTTTEEPTIKKKRKRADANQLRILNETYARTAFPSTEERLALAKLLDMQPRSVQIWFQNKRQSMRQTNRQTSSSSATTHQTYTTVSPTESIPDMGHSSSAYSNSTMPMSDVQYLTAPPQESRAHTPHTSSSHHRIRGQEDVEPRKWSRGF